MFGHRRAVESLETLHNDSHQGNLIPVVRELPADLETPVSVFLKLGKRAPSFLLESVERGEQLGRCSCRRPEGLLRRWEDGIYCGQRCA